MSSLDSSSLRSSVSGVVAVTITALILWSFYAYVGYLEQSAPSASTAQLESGTDRDTRNG